MTQCKWMGTSTNSMEKIDFSFWLFFLYTKVFFHSESFAFTKKKRNPVWASKLHISDIFFARICIQRWKQGLNIMRTKIERNCFRLGAADENESIIRRWFYKFPFVLYYLELNCEVDIDDFVRNKTSFKSAFVVCLERLR